MQITEHRESSALGYLFFALMAVTLSCSSNKHSNGSDSDSDSETDSENDTDSNSDINSDGTENDSTTSSESADIDTIPRFDTDTNGDCVHPVVTENCSDGWCEIPAGCYTMGSNPREPCRGKNTENQGKVQLTRSFQIAQSEVTVAQWMGFGFPYPGRGEADPALPVGWLNWFEAAAYCNALSEKEGLDPCYDLSNCGGTIGAGCPSDPESYFEWGCLTEYETHLYLENIYKCEGDVHKYSNWYECPGYRLPTQPEMEYAVRAGTTTATYAGDVTASADATESTCEQDPILDDIAWYCYNADGGPHPPGQKRPNGWGLYDALGNMSEWMDTVFDGFSVVDAEGNPDIMVDPLGAPYGTTDNMRLIRSSYRLGPCATRVSEAGGDSAAGRGAHFGFRPVRTLFQPSKKSE